MQRQTKGPLVPPLTAGRCSVQIGQIGSVVGKLVLNSLRPSGTSLQDLYMDWHAVVIGLQKDRGRAPRYRLLSAVGLVPSASESTREVVEVQLARTSSQNRVRFQSRRWWRP